MHLLGGLRHTAPGLYARVTQAHRAGADEFALVLDSLVIRTAADVTVTRLKDIFPVEADLARNRLRAVELDLRFRDQVIARQP
jgi:cell division protein FtsQ